MMTIGMMTYCRRILVVLLCVLSLNANAVVRMGSLFFDPPLVLSSSQGFNITLANRICQGIGQQCEIVQMDWSKLFPALENNQIDLILGVYITPARQQKYLFSLPYMLSQGRFLTLVENNVSTVEQLQGKNVGLLTEEAGTGVFHQYVAQNFAGLFQVTDFNDVEGLLSALINKSVSAIIIPNAIIDYWIQSGSGKFVTIGSPFNLGEGTAIMGLPQNQALIDSINQEIKNMENNGDYLSIYKMYFQ